METIILGFRAWGYDSTNGESNGEQKGQSFGNWDYVGVCRVWRFLREKKRGPVETLIVHSPYNGTPLL